MKMSHLFAALAVAAAGFLFAGCQDTINTVQNTDSSMRVDPVDMKRFTTDSFCRDRLFLVQMARATTPGGVMRVQAAVRSERYGFWSEIWSWFRGDNPYHIHYKFDWFDGNGMKVSTPADVWQTMIFIPGETKYLDGAAPNSKCKDFVLSLKEADSTH